MGDAKRRMMAQVSARCVRIACAILAVLSFTACDRSDYPEGWPAHASNFFSRKGGCPDLAGEYDGVDEHFVALFFGGDALAQRERYVEHKATIAQPGDGASLTIDLAVNEHGLDQLEAGKGGGNVWNGYRHIVRQRNADYRCNAGWMEFDGMRLGRDRSGALLSHRVIEHDGAVDLGGGSRIQTGTQVRNVWLRWPARDPARDATLDSRGHFALRRADWINHGRSTPVYLTGFFAKPLCARYVHRYGKAPDAVRTFAVGSVSDALRPADDECPAGWARVASGETQLQEMNIADDDGEQYRYAWFRLGEAPADARVIEINDAARLPSGEGLRIGQASLQVN